LPSHCYDNKLLVVLSHDGYLKVLNIDNGQIVTSLNDECSNPTTNDQLITQIFCSLNSRYLGSISQNGAILVYDLDNCLAIKNMKNTNKLAVKSTTINSSVNRSSVNNNNKVCSLISQEKNNRIASVKINNIYFFLFNLCLCFFLESKSSIE
jgi:hypothetical protein